MKTRTIRAAQLICALAILPHAHAQNEEDALRIGTLMPGGTGRSAGMANAFGAVGADPASIGINPAGFGLYRTSELSLTPLVEVNDAKATTYGTATGDTQTRFAIGNLALILNTPSNGGDWRSGTFGVVMDRQQSHNRRVQANGTRVPSTFLESLAIDAEGIGNDAVHDALPFTSGLAWETFAINPLDPDDSLGTSYLPAIPFGELTDQEHSMVSRGASTNTAFFYSGNYKDRLYLGMSVGISAHRFKRTTTHRETSLNTDLDLETATWTEELNTTGNGIDVKVGVIGRLTDRFRMGGSFHSPQWMQLSDAYVSDMVTTFRTTDVNGDSRYTSTSPDGSFSYRVHTPWRLVGSAAYVAGKNGLVSMDYEFHDPSKARFRTSDRLVSTYTYDVENEGIRAAFRPVHSLRVGTEWRFGNWYYRMGWALSSNPYVAEDGRRGDAWKNYAGGIGYRTDHVAVDLGTNLGLQQTRYYPYNAFLVNSTQVDRSDLRFLVTLSVRP
ncbi:MAG: hypothetical protein IPO05_01875 [Flavobacteriales bacterium]|mgnify:CR=1 FL=1|jgi:hypothetical protein|nr:hypothetical protein [Flavobacteriales bacterium]MBK9512384.1 hypothetical protein [Flavobacteriales bacterium]MBP7450146.1 hypothetical protein [Flavobacteriales bacterium]HOZ39316.1 hypothetical protein [Flavobacteriales bacterium]